MSTELLECLHSTQGDYKKIITLAKSGVYLYGAGFIGRWAVSYLESIGVPVFGFVDSDQKKWGAIINGKQVYSPSDSCVIQAKVIIITTRHAVKPVEKLLAHLQAATMSIDAMVVHRASEDGSIEKVKELFSHDKLSLLTFNAVLSSMLSGTTRPLMPIADSRPFFERFGFFNRDQEIFVDAGAYVGDSLERFIWSVNGVFRQVHAFEPGVTQFEALKKRVCRLSQEWALKPESIYLINKGLSFENKKISVASPENLIQMTMTDVDVSPNAYDTSNIELTSLDSYFDGRRYTLLKVDVEGSEAALLQGARQSIATYKPRIALSVYHYPTDIFNLPLQLKNINQDYIFCLGHHSSQLMDTVLYASEKDD
ncbi:TPA: FkbM family methyltransferase [Aeromonas veronii]